MIKITNRDPTSSRERKLTRWSLHEDSQGTYLKGVVTEDSEPDFRGVAIRFTSTSYLVSIKGRVATTRSGSTYELLEPLTDQQDLEPNMEKTFSTSGLF